MGHPWCRGINLTAGDAVAPSNTAKTRKAFLTEMMKKKEKKKLTIGSTVSFTGTSLYLFAQSFSVNVSVKDKIDWFMINRTF